MNIHEVAPPMIYDMDHVLHHDGRILRDITFLLLLKAAIVFLFLSTAYLASFGIIRVCFLLMKWQTSITSLLQAHQRRA